MTELRNVQADLTRFRARILVASVVVVACLLVLLMPQRRAPDPDANRPL